MPPDARNFSECRLCGDIEYTPDLTNGICLSCTAGIVFAWNARRAYIVPICNHAGMPIIDGRCGNCNRRLTPKPTASMLNAVSECLYPHLVELHVAEKERAQICESVTARLIGYWHAQILEPEKEDNEY